MKLKVCALLLALGATGVTHAQTAQDMQRANPASRAGESPEQHGRRLLDEMLSALGGEAWLNKRTSTIEGQTASFFSGAPTGSVIRFVQYRRYANGPAPDATRIEFLTVRGMIAPGMKKDVVHLWTDRQGYELTFKGRTILPDLQVKDFYRRQAHSLEEVMRTWIKAPGVVIVYEGADMRDRRPVDKVSVLTAANDSMTIEIEQGTHLPLQRSFEWRNDQFKDHDVDEEVYGDWRTYDGIATPMNMTSYKNGDMVAQNFYTKVKFNGALEPELFDSDRSCKKK